MLVNSKFKALFVHKQFRLLTTLLVVLAFLGAQSVATQHNHDGDLSHHVDCTVCVKQGAEFDALPSGFDLPDAVKQIATVLPNLRSANSIPLPVARSRGPPLSNS